MTTGASRTQLGEYNIKAVIHALRRLGPSSQREIAAQAGLSVQAVSVILRGLSQRGMVRELHSESIGRGRPRTVLDLVPESAYSIGVHIDPALITAVLLDLHGTPLQTELGVTTVFVTHDQAEALALADRMAVMKDGKILQVGTPREVFHAPRTRFVAGFIGSHPMNLVDGTVHGRHVRSFGIHLPLSADATSPNGDTLADGTPVTIGVRPEYVGFTPQQGSENGMRSSEEEVQISAEIASVENLGASVLATGRLGEERIQSIVPDHLAPEAGDQGVFSIPLARVVVFDDATGERIGAGAPSANGEQITDGAP